jgi:hypothetical protein
MFAFREKKLIERKGLAPMPALKGMVHDHAQGTMTMGHNNMSNMITDWTDEKTAQFQKEILTFKHRLSETGLFTDEALIALLENHPSHMLDVCTMGTPDDPNYPNKFRTGDFRNVSGETLLNAAKAGTVWINLRRAMNVHAEYKETLDKIYADLSELTGKSVYNANGGILISSPMARVPYHFDKTETILWHVRGKKRMYIYPMTPEFISDESHENTLTNYLDDDLPYFDYFEDHATIIDFEEDQAAAWPLNSPHRVDNQAFCVSVTTEYSTRESAMKNAAMITNATLRHRFGMNPSYTNDSQVARQLKSVFGRVIKKAKLVPDTSGVDLVTFRIDPDTPGYIVDTEPFERNF